MIKNFESKFGIIIGQAPPEKNNIIPFLRTRLYGWLSKIDVPQEKALSIFEFDALIDYYPGRTSRGHNIPTEKEIKCHLPLIIQRIQKENFKIIIPVGKLAISYVLGTLKVDLKKTIGQKYFQIPFGSNNLKPVIIIPLPHPSGSNTWPFEKYNKLLLSQALLLIKDELNF